MEYRDLAANRFVDPRCRDDRNTVCAEKPERFRVFELRVLHVDLDPSDLPHAEQSRGDGDRHDEPRREHRAEERHHGHVGHHSEGDVDDIGELEFEEAEGDAERNENSNEDRGVGAEFVEDGERVRVFFGGEPQHQRQAGEPLRDKHECNTASRNRLGSRNRAHGIVRLKSSTTPRTARLRRRFRGCIQAEWRHRRGR